MLLRVGCGFCSASGQDVRSGFDPLRNLAELFGSCDLRAPERMGGVCSRIHINPIERESMPTELEERPYQHRLAPHDRPLSESYPTWRETSQGSLI
jgi:hypothetical protein